MKDWSEGPYMRNLIMKNDEEVIKIFNGSFIKRESYLMSGMAPPFDRDKNTWSDINLSNFILYFEAGDKVTISGPWRVFIKL